MDWLLIAGFTSLITGAILLMLVVLKDEAKEKPMKPKELKQRREEAERRKRNRDAVAVEWEFLVGLFKFVKDKQKGK